MFEEFNDQIAYPDADAMHRWLRLVKTRSLTAPKCADSAKVAYFADALVERIHLTMT